MKISKIAKGCFKGFTLAEVLITLAIIGVVAAMTVPTLMTSTRGKEYEVGAQKAMATIANAMQMRYAMDGQTFADFRGATTNSYSGNDALMQYLTVPPGDRVGEKPPLSTTECYEGTWSSLCKLSDGMVIIRTASYCQDMAYIMIDTNGEKGPTRFSQQLQQSGGDYSCSAQAWDAPRVDYEYTKPKASIHENTTLRANETNMNPDVVVFAVNGHTGDVKPAGQRTRNILATGNILISQ